MHGRFSIIGACTARVAPKVYAYAYIVLDHFVKSTCSFLYLSKWCWVLMYIIYHRCRRRRLHHHHHQLANEQLRGLSHKQTCFLCCTQSLTSARANSANRSLEDRRSGIVINLFLSSSYRSTGIDETYSLNLAALNSTSPITPATAVEEEEERTMKRWLLLQVIVKSLPFHGNMDLRLAW